MNLTSDKAKDRSKRTQTVRSVVVTGALALFMGLWGVIYSHQTPTAADATTIQPVGAVSGSALDGQASSASARAATPKQAAVKPAAQVHTRTRAS